jgi:RNA polymerase sigma-70 factor, ECF subfamily
MSEHDWLAERFEENRGHMRAVAYRMLGSLTEADDAIQEAWLRLSRSNAGEIGNLGAWLTTVVARVSLDMLRSRTSRREESMDEHVPQPGARRGTESNPEQEALLADAVGLALLVVLERLTPAERVAFVLHDMFAVPFDEIGEIVGREPAAARQLASRARRRVRGPVHPPDSNLSEQRTMIDRFLAALRAGDIEGLVALLDPDLVVSVDQVSRAPGAPEEVHGAREWAKQAVTYSRGARFASAVLVNGTVGAVVAPRGKLFRALTFRFANDKIARIEVIGDPARLAELELAALDHTAES